MTLVSAAVCSIFVTLVAVASALAQQVTVERDSELRAEARHDAPVVAKVKQGTNGDVTAKSGAWLNVKTQETSGWLFSFNVRFHVKPAEGAEPAPGGASVLGRLFGPRRSVSVTSTIGIRGLEEEDLRQARFDAEQLRQLDEYAASREAAEERARTSGLAAGRVEYLDEQPR